MRHTVLDSGDFKKVDQLAPDHITFPSSRDMFSMPANLITGLSGVSGGRILLGAKASLQAIPLTKPERALVESSDVTNKHSTQEAWGKHYLSVTATKPGKVEEVTKDHIKVKNEDGTSHTYQLYNNFNLGRKSFISHEAQVKPGQHIEANQVLASSNYTDKQGNMAIGTNLTTAIMPFRSDNFEDAYAVSESGAKKLEAEQMIKFHIEKKFGVEAGKPKFISLFPNKYTNSQIASIDNDGIIKPGSKLTAGDPVILAYSPRALKSTDLALGKLSKVLKHAFKDNSETWDFEHEGEVVDVAKHNDLVTVHIKTSRSLLPGDKIGCVTPDHEVLTSEGWKNITEISLQDYVYTLNPDNHNIELQQPIAIPSGDYVGNLYSLNSTQVSILATPNHNFYIKQRKWPTDYRNSRYTLTQASTISGKRYKLKNNGSWSGVSPKFVKVEDMQVPTKTYLTVLGLFLGAGSTFWNEKSGSYGFDICQKKEPETTIIYNKLTELGIKFYKGKNTFRVYSKAWATHLKQFGKAHDKFIPDSVFNYNIEDLKVLYKYLMLTDGCEKGTTLSYTSVSRRLADGIQRLCLHIGYAAKVTYRERNRWVTFPGGHTTFNKGAFEVFIYRTKNEPEINHGHTLQQTGQEEKWIKYSGKIYCLSFSKNHIFYIRHNGKCHWTGNSIFGAKGVATIIPDAQCPTQTNGEPIDIMLNSMSITSRVAPALAVTLGLGKLAQKKGHTIKMDQFRKESAIQNVVDVLKKNDIQDTEKLYDPTTGRHIEAVVGPLFFNRLTHISEDKLSTRSQGVGYCFDDKTDVLTNRGWVNWSEVLDDDQFFTTKDYKNATYCKASEIIRQDYDGLMYGFDDKGIDYLVTPNHKFLVRVEATGKLLTKTAEEFHNKRGSFIKGGIKLCDSTSTGNISIPSISTKGKFFDEVSISSTDFSKFLGIWISEGSVRFDENEGRYRVYVWQDQKANPKKYHKIQKMLKLLPFDWYVHKSSEGINKGFYTSHAGLANYLIKNIGKYCENKRIPAWLLTSNQRNRLLILKYLIMGDGTKYEHGYNYYTCSKELADSVQQLCILSGLYASVRDYKYDKNINKQYVVIITKDKTHYLRNQKNKKYRNFYTTNYSGKIYCARIPETGLLYVRRNGKCFLSHNSFDNQPSKSVGESSKRIGNLGTTALLSHDVRHVLEDIGTVKGTKNDEFWRALKLGQTPPTPKVPFIFNKFIASLQSAGVNVERTGDTFNIMPMTDKDTLKLSSGAINKPGMFKPHLDELVFEPGGLFDPTKVGLLGDKFNHVDLNTPVPNPISEDYLRKLLGVTKAAYNDLVISGDIVKKLEAMNLDSKIAEQKKYIESGKRTNRDTAVKLLEFLTTLKKKGIHPKDLMIHKVPILPAQYRPASKMGDVVLTSDVNNLYKDLILNNNELKDTKDLPKEITDKLKQNQYSAVKAVFGLGDSINKKHVDKNIKGILSTMLGLKGGTAKSTMFQSKVVNKSLDLVGRAVLTPDARLDVDQASVPQDLLWQVYKPFIIRRLVMKGVSATAAVDYVKKHNSMAVQALREEMQVRPGIVTRDPAWHKFNLMGFNLIPNANPKDKTVKLNPLVFKGFGADNDGDQLNIHVPATEEARKEVLEKMLPSKNLLSPKSFQPVLIPSNEAALGLYSLSTENNHNTPKKFKTEKEVVNAYNKGELAAGDQVEIEN
jgi:DNA-directed RNA polymerase beta' subunit